MVSTYYYIQKTREDKEYLKLGQYDSKRKKLSYEWVDTVFKATQFVDDLHALQASKNLFGPKTKTVIFKNVFKEDR